MATITKYAVGKRAKGCCDICGVAYLLSELRGTTVRGQLTHIKACPVCWDKDHEQNFLPEALAIDAQALRDPRPENYYASRILPHWRPCDAFPMAAALGDVEVLTP